MKKERKPSKKDGKQPKYDKKEYGSMDKKPLSKVPKKGPGKDRL
jgi:hypothetical protein